MRALLLGACLGITACGLTGDAGESDAMLVASIRANADRINAVDPGSYQAQDLRSKGRLSHILAISHRLALTNTGQREWIPADSVAMTFAAGRLMTVTELDPDTLSPTRFVTRYSYDSNGVLSRVEKRNATLVASGAEVHFDMSTRVMTWSGPDSLYPGTPWRNRYYFGRRFTLDSMVWSDSEPVTIRYQYDALDRPMRMETDYGGETHYESFSYAEGRLQSRVTSGPSGSGMQTWNHRYLEFDSLGNWTRMQVTSPELPAADIGYIRRIEYRDSP